MARVRDWIGGFLKRHRAKYNPHDWPDGSDSEESRAFLEGWIKVFATKEVTEAEAEAASLSLVETPPNFRREHVPMVMAAIESMRAQRGTRPGTGTREAVRDESRNCEHCSGDGMTTTWAAKPDAERKIPPTLAAYCTCSHGRWIKRCHAEKAPELLRRIPDFGEVLDGFKPGWLAAPPGQPNMNVPEPEPTPTQHEPAVTKAQINAMFRMPGR